MTLTVTATDAGGLSTSRVLELPVADVNKAPEGIALAGDGLVENLEGAAAGRLTATDPDGDALGWSVSDTRFEVADGVLKLKPGVALDAEAEPAVTLTVTATDAGGLATSRVLELPVADVNEAPEGIALAGDGLVENLEGAAAGRLTATDPDGDALGWSVSDARFEVADGVLKLKPGVALDAEAEPAVTLTVTATDAGGLSTSRVLELPVADVNEAPEGIVLAGDGLVENLEGAAAGRLTATDPDGDALGWSVSDTRFEVADGVLKLKPGVALDAEAEPAVTLTVTATDAGGLSTSRVLELPVADVEEPMPSERISLRTGFNVEVFDPGRARAPSDVDWSATPERVGIVDELDLKGYYELDDDRGRPTKPALRVTGHFEVGEGGDYTFRSSTPPDDMILKIDGVEVGHDGDGVVDLAPGSHELEILYLTTGKPRFPVKWSGPDLDGMEVPTASPDLEVEQNGMLRLDFDVDGAAPSNVVLSNLPADTILIDGEHSVVSDGSPLDVTGWNLDHLTLAPPPDFVGTIELGVSLDHGAEGAIFEIEVVPDPDLSAPMAFETIAAPPIAFDAGWADAAADIFAAMDAALDALSEHPVDVEAHAGETISFDSYERHDW